MKLQLHKSKKKLTSRYIFFSSSGVRCFLQRWSDQRCDNKGVREAGCWWLPDTVCVYSLALSMWTAAHQPAEPMQGREVSAEDLVSVRWEQIPCRYAELKWNWCRRELLLPLRDIDFQWRNRDCWSRRLSQTEHESQEWPWHMMDTNVAREAAFLSLSHTIHLLHCCSTDPYRRRGKGKGRAVAWIPVAPSWTLAPFNVWSLMFHVEFTEMGSFKDNLIGQS